MYLCPCPAVHLPLSLNSIEEALLAWEIYAYIAKASEINKQKWNKQ